MVAVTALNSMDERVVRKLVQQHFHKTGSARARQLIAQWETYRTLFRKVAPPQPAGRAAELEPVVQLQPTGSRA
jgi:glutamate synthase domain-containing protein 3